jgi:RNA polymerase sigma-70 factor (ECF subfamily)
VRTHLPRAYAVARRILLNPQDAEEAAQEAFTKVWLKAAEWQPGRAAFTTWLHRVVVNTALDMTRKRQSGMVRDPLVLEALQDGAASTEEVLMERQEQALVHEAVATLTAPQRAAITLCYFQDMTNEEAAASMGIHLKALEGLLVRARKTLRGILPRKEQRHAA